MGPFEVASPDFGDTLADAGVELPWALLRVLDNNGADTGFGIVRSPVGTAASETLRGFARNRLLLGFTSYGTFPRVHPVFDGPELAESGLDGRERPEVTMCVAWAHCFRDPDSYVPADRPRELISLSDFTDPDWVSPVNFRASSAQKRWDLICVCLPNPFNELTKNWELAKACVTRLVRSLGLAVLLVGREGTSDVPELPGVDTCGELPWHELMSYLGQSRIAFFPNVLDASPVLLTEALCLDVPVVVNRRILGGWKYVAPTTGRFFDGEEDVAVAVKACLDGRHSPRAWYTANYGPDRAGRRLAAFLNEIATKARALE